jgi:hypothetical protein
MQLPSSEQKGTGHHTKEDLFRSSLELENPLHVHTIQSHCPSLLSESALLNAESHLRYVHKARGPVLEPYSGWIPLTSLWPGSGGLAVG